MRHGPLISVVIPTFNRARQVIAALESVLAQTYIALDVIVVDDGSTDHTPEAIRDFISRQGASAAKIRLVSQHNQGQSCARNKGIAEARGQWIAFLDSDDVWGRDKIEWQIRAVEECGRTCGACITDAMLTNYHDKPVTAFGECGRSFDRMMAVDDNSVVNLAGSFEPYWVSTLLARTDLVRQIGGFDPKIRFAEDHDFNFRLSLATPICYVNKPLASIDRLDSPLGSDCRPWDRLEVRLRNRQAMFEKWLRLNPRLPPDVRTIIVRNLRNIHSEWANWYLQDKRYTDARSAVAAAIRCEFTAALAIKLALTWVAPSVARRISLNLNHNS